MDATLSSPAAASLIVTLAASLGAIYFFTLALVDLTHL